METILCCQAETTELTLTDSLVLWDQLDRRDQWDILVLVDVQETRDPKVGPESPESRDLKALPEPSAEWDPTVGRVERESWATLARPLPNRRSTIWRSEFYRRESEIWSPICKARRARTIWEDRVPRVPRDNRDCRENRVWRDVREDKGSKVFREWKEFSANKEISDFRGRQEKEATPESARRDPWEPREDYPDRRARPVLESTARRAHRVSWETEDCRDSSVPRGQPVPQMSARIATLTFPFLLIIRDPDSGLFSRGLRLCISSYKLSLFLFFFSH